MEKKIEVVPDDQLLALVNRAASGFEFEDPDAGWDVRWAADLLNSDIVQVGVITPLTLRKVLHLVVRASNEHLRGSRARKDGLSIEDCPHSKYLAEFDHFVLFDASNWKLGWKSSQATQVSSDSITQPKTPELPFGEAISVKFTSSYTTVASRLSEQYPGFENCLAQGVGQILMEVKRKHYRNADKVREFFLYASIGMPAVKVLYKTDGRSIDFVGLDLQAMQPPML